MEEKDKVRIHQVLEQFLNEHLDAIIISNPLDKSGIQKVKVRPLVMKGQLVFQAEEFVGRQTFHKNLLKPEAKEYVTCLLEHQMKQAELRSLSEHAHILVSKKGRTTVKQKQISALEAEIPARSLNHNRKKNYILEEGKPVPFLQDLGVMTADGTIVKAKYDKFKQINRFLEFIEDVLPRLDKEKENTIIDFGCGKSYLTFAMYYYLKELKGYEIKVIGLDLKQEVINRCSQLSDRYGFDNLKFYHGDIASYEGVEHVDMVVSLHACDTATDYAIAKAVRWEADIILSVPCCQHELNQQLHNEFLSPLHQYGVIKERVAALYTDALRAQLLESHGYRTQILEFIDIEHTPKNLLIRAIRQGEKRGNQKELEDIFQFLQIEPTLAKLLNF